MLITPKVEVGRCYTSIALGIFIVKHISMNGILVTIINKYGEERKLSYLMFDEEQDRSFKCREISRDFFIKEYKNNSKDYTLRFLYEDKPRERLKGVTKFRKIRAVYQVCQQQEYCY